MIAFAPGTLLALFLNSVKRRMNEENERLRLEQVEEELAGEVAREQKDLVLTQMIEELRERIQQLEREARGDTIAQKASGTIATQEKPLTDKTVIPDTDKNVLAAVEKPVEPPSRTELPPFLQEYEETLRPWLDRFDLLKAELGKLQERLAPASTADDDQKTPVASKRRSAAVTDKSGVGASGIRERVAERERQMLAQDVRAAKELASNSSESP
jgi:hypothetical protein